MKRYAHVKSKVQDNKSRMILMLIHNTLEWGKEIVGWGLDIIKNTVTKFVIISFTFLVLLWMSVFMYGSFYYMYMPPVSLVKPVEFGFRVCEDGLQMCSFPKANLTLLKEGYSEVFVRGEAYSIKMNIDLPESQANKEIGMFMTKLSLYDRVGETVACATKSAMLQYRSELLRVIDTFVFSPLFLSGFAEQKQSLVIEYYTDYKDDAYKPAVGAVIEIQSLKIQIYSAVLKVHAHFSGLRYLLFYWPVFSAAVGISMNMMFLSFIAFLSWYNFLWNEEKKEVSKSHHHKKLTHYEMRRLQMKSRLDKEREEQIQEDENYSRLAKNYLEESDTKQPDTLGTREYTEKSKQDEESEETFIIAKDFSEPDCDTELRHRKQVNTS